MLFSHRPEAVLWLMGWQAMVWFGDDQIQGVGCLGGDGEGATNKASPADQSRRTNSTCPSDWLVCLDLF